MGQYTIRRSIQAVPLLLGIATISFVFMQLAPGGPLALLAHNPRMTQAQLNNPFGLTRGPDGALYFCDVENQRVRKITPETRNETRRSGARTAAGEHDDRQNSGM